MKNFISIVLVIGLLALQATTITPDVVSAQSASLDVWVSVDDADYDGVVATLEATGIGLVITRVDPADFDDEVLAASPIVGNCLPDAFVTGSNSVPKLAKREVAASLGATRNPVLYPAVERTAAYFKYDENGALIADQIVQYGIPFISKTVALFVNTLRWGSEIGTIDEFYYAALHANDQTVPSDPKYGYAFTDLPDSALALFYGNGTSIFEDMYVDIAHLGIEDAAQLGTLAKLNWMANVRQLNPDWDDQGTENARELFVNEGNLAMIIDESTALADIKTGAVFGSELTNLTVIPVPGNGAPIRSIALVPTVNATLSEVQQLGTALIATDAQTAMWNTHNLLPSISGVLSGEAKSAEYAFDATLCSGKQLPINPKWAQVEEVFSGQVSKMLKGDQDHSRTAIALDLEFRALLQVNQAFAPIPIYGVVEYTTTTGDTDESSDSPYSAAIAIATISLIAVVALTTRRRRRES